MEDEVNDRDLFTPYELAALDAIPDKSAVSFKRLKRILRAARKAERDADK